MNAVYFDQTMTDDERRTRLYDGDLVVYRTSPAALALTEFAREMCEAAFAPHHPRTAQFSMEVEAYAALLADLKPKFIHHPESKRLIQNLLRELGCDLDATYFDVPRLRTSTSDNYLTTGIAYAFHPHRDTWYSAPQMQLNWWLPVYDITADNCLAFHPKYWNTPLKNSSRVYNYTEWNQTSRQNAAQHVKTDTRVQPKPEEEVELDPQLRIVGPAGSLVLFSAAQLHSSVPNSSGVTRLSIDFRTVHMADVKAHRGAKNIDSKCTGTNIGDFLQTSSYTPIDRAIVTEYDTPPLATA